MANRVVSRSSSRTGDIEVAWKAIAKELKIRMRQCSAVEYLIHLIDKEERKRRREN